MKRSQQRGEYGVWKKNRKMMTIIVATNVVANCLNTDGLECQSLVSKITGPSQPEFLTRIFSLSQVPSLIVKSICFLPHSAPSWILS